MGINLCHSQTFFCIRGMWPGVAGGGGGEVGIDTLLGEIS